jgi:hypothetical protein
MSKRHTPLASSAFDIVRSIGHTSRAHAARKLAARSGATACITHFIADAAPTATNEAGG